MVKVFFSPFAWNKLKTTHCFICQVSHFDPNSGVEACEECQASSKFCRKKDFASTHPNLPPLHHRHYLPSDPAVASKRLSNNLSERRTDPLGLCFFSGDLWKICKKKTRFAFKGLFRFFFPFSFTPQPKILFVVISCNSPLSPAFAWEDISPTQPGYFAGFNFPYVVKVVVIKC